MLNANHRRNLRIASFLVCLVSIAVIAVSVFFASKLETDTRPNAFLDNDTPALVYRQKVEEIFGLSDPLIIALVDRSETGVFNPKSLKNLADLTEAVAALENINANRVMSLASEKRIESSALGMEITDFLNPVPTSEAQIANLRDAVYDFPLLVGNLVSEDGKVALIVAELVDEFEVDATYNRMMALAQEFRDQRGAEVHVAGEGAIAGYLSQYIDADAKYLNPLAWVIIMLILFLAYRRFSPPLLANIIIAASVLIALGIMALVEIPFYMITSALPVILIGISVADIIHLFGRYFELKRRSPEAETVDLVRATLGDMWRPITLTSLTTAAGFMGLYISAFMPPFKYFGLFAAIGVSFAWLYSLVFLPAAILLTNPKGSPLFNATSGHKADDRYTLMMLALGRFTTRFARPLVGCSAAVCLIGAFAASQIIVDEEPITIFHQSEPLYQADTVMNQHLAGTNALDIVIESSQADGLLQPEAMQKIEALQRYAQTLPHVGGSTSYVDYLKQMNRSINDGNRDYYRIPESEELAAQYFLIYSATGDPTDFEEEIDYNFQTANVRLLLNTGSYAKFAPVVDQLQTWLEQHFTDPSLRATMSGRVKLNYVWISSLGKSHALGLITSLYLVWLVSTLVFRSAWAGTYAMLPVAGAILLVYATMVLMDIRLGVGTSMFAAVALGLGVDFSIHTLERFRVIYAELGDQWERIFEEFYRTTGRALFFNFLAILCGFGVLISSKVTSLNQFGTMILVSITTSFIASMTVLPAMIRLFRPRFVTGSENRPRYYIEAKTLIAVGLVTVLTWLVLLPAARADETNNTVTDSAITAEQIVQNINGVDDGVQLTRSLVMRLVDRRGKERVRETRVYRKEYGGETRTIAFYTSPANVRGTSFLTWDYADTQKDDDQWLYLPALRKVRRISAADRGDYFMGTDFTYEDIKLDGKLSESDYQYTILATPAEQGVESYRLRAVPVSQDIAKELGYSSIEFEVNPDNWLVTQGEYMDNKQRPLKTLRVVKFSQIDGIWSRTHIEVNNHSTGHKTVFQFKDVDYHSEVGDQLLTQRAMERGARR